MSRISVHTVLADKHSAPHALPPLLNLLREFGIFRATRGLPAEQTITEQNIGRLPQQHLLSVLHLVSAFHSVLPCYSNFAMRVAEYDPASNASLIQGKVFVVTGGEVYKTPHRRLALTDDRSDWQQGTGGLGKETVLELAKHEPAHIIFTGRDAARAEANIDAAKANGATTVTFITCDLASLASVKQASQQILVSVSSIDVLICNAGIMAVSPALTKDGYETQFGTNHMGHALLIQSLLPAIQEAEAGRIVTLTSLGYGLAPKGGIQFDTLKTTRAAGLGANWTNYGQSKLANLLYARALAKRNPHITSVVIHPGVVRTELVSKLGFMDRMIVHLTTWFSQIEPKQVAYNTLWAATTAKENLENGGFYEPVGEPGREDVHSRKVELADALWERTEKELSSYL